MKEFVYSETYSPVAKMTTLRILLALENQRNLHVYQMDVKTAFLNGGLTEEIYMRQPSSFEAGNGLVCKLKKSRLWIETGVLELEFAIPYVHL